MLDMDPVGPWSYAPYNRLAGVQTGSGSGELHHHLPSGATAGAPATTTTQLLPGGFLSPSPVGYEVFSPLFHHASAKPSHYVTQHRQALVQAQAAVSKQTSEGEYHQTQAFFEQGAAAWQQSSPFGILPHESVVPTTTSKSTYENFNAHFAAAQSLNHLNSQLAAANMKNSVTRAESPHVTTTISKPTSTQSNSNTFFQVPTTFASTDTNSNSKFSSSSSTNLQQSCIVTSPSNTTASKEYRVPQAPTRTSFLTSSNPVRTTMDKSFNTSTKQPPTPQIQTKAQTKIYPELTNQTDRQRTADETQSQSSPISFSMDAAGRMNYSAGNSAKRNPFQQSNYRHYQATANSENEFQRPKSGSDYSTTNGPDCNVVVPRRPSPLQAHSQASPLGHAPSPVYPLYNSPMNSISSPQQNSTNQVTPPSPLDVSVPRPSSQTGSVAYPSVITRTLNTEKSYPERFDRQPPQQQQNQQNCWDERSQARKFQPQTNNQNNYSTNNNAVEIPSRQVELTSRNEQSQQRTTSSTNISERQQTYFDASHQVTLQDLSSCRGDPMSIVKNLQQQQSCQVQQTEIKQEVKIPSKRRKSSEKPVPNETPTPPTEYFAGRIPPPAHSSGTNQQQQNGTYFDFDRWNLPPPTKIFSTQTIHQQHQGLMVPHPHSHHPPPPLPYFPPFHLTPHPSEFPSSVELTPITTYSEQSPQPTTAQFPQTEEQPKVVVPNIEEELNFLSETTVKSTIANNNVQSVNKNANKITGPGTGFMNSYLKFLQGERDSSPPPPTRGGRKQTWTNTKPKTETKLLESNGIPPVPQPPPIRLTQGDPQDDPRYFPLPKERKNNNFDSSDDGFSSEDDIFSKKIPPLIKDPPKEKTGRKGRPCKPGGPTERKRARQAALLKRQEEKSREVKDKEPLQRRETSKRAAKEKISLQQLISKTGVEEEAEEPTEFVDSDSDPAWTPLAKEEHDEEQPTKKGRRGRPSTRGRGRGTRNLITAAAQGAGIQEIDGYASDSSHIKKNKTSGTKQKQSSLHEEASNQHNTLNNVSNDSPFKPGEFVVIKSELNQEWPAIWRVDGRTLLQKYEPFEQNGQTLYRNISTYTSWTPESKKQYIAVPVRCKSGNPMETVVEFLKSEMNILDEDFLRKFMKENEVYQDNFEVYIQTLISQALDSNFLTEIFQEQDDYFLSNVKIIDDITDNKKQKLINMLRWPHPVQAAVSTWPCFNVIRELSADSDVKLCVACSQSSISVRVLMYGQPYNSTTLDGCQPDPQTVNQKDFFMCRICASRVELYNKITHQKYLMYIECAKHVAEKRQQDANKDTTFILNELLADENWLSQLFAEVRTTWAEVDNFERMYLTKMPTVQ